MFDEIDEVCVAGEIEISNRTKLHNIGVKNWCDCVYVGSCKT